MSLVVIFYILNAILIILHEIESAYEKEWEILKLPGKITGFIILHIPVLFIIFYGLLEIHKQTLAGLIIGIITGAGGMLPFFVHKIFVKRGDKFDKPISNILIYLNIFTGIILIILSTRLIILI